MPSATSTTDTGGIPPLRISIDRGGTFTDCIANVRGQSDIVIKILSVDDKNYPDAPTEAIRRVLEAYYGRSVPRGTSLDLRDVEWVRMGTTVATNALLERKGERTALLVTEGFRDVLVIGNQSRPFMFDLSIRRPEVLYSNVFEVSERVVPNTCADSQLRKLDMAHPVPEETVTAISGEKLRVVKALDIDSVRRYLLSIYNQGFRSIAVCLMHAYIFPRHELQIRDLARGVGFEYISLSHQVSPRSKIVPRGNSAVVDGYLTPEIERYLRQFTASFADLEKSNARIDFMQSDGGLVPSGQLSGLRAILSGPAGGVVGYARTCFDGESPIIGFDMGGTSTDVSRYDGSFDHVFETTMAGIPVHVPQLNVSTIAAGGGSILGWRDGLMVAGPESASSSPGPASYRKGGPLTITDANLALGRLLPEYFPSIFGPNEDQPLDRDMVIAKFKALTETINQESGQSLSWPDIADGFLQVANQAMCGPIRALTEARGHDVTKHHLASFGGAGGQHAIAIADILGIKKVVIHKYSSILSAHGIGLADIVHEEQKPCSKNIDTSSAEITRELGDLAAQASSHSSMKPCKSVTVHNFFSMRYDGSETLLMVSADEGSDPRQAFIDAHHQQFGFTPTNRAIFVDAVRVRVVGGYSSGIEDAEQQTVRSKTVVPERTSKLACKPTSTSSVYFTATGWTETPVYLFENLVEGGPVKGPALIVDKTQTILVGLRSSACLQGETLFLDSTGADKKTSGDDVSVSNADIQADAKVETDPIQLSVFRHRFFGIAEQMGRVLQQVSVSANIKERLNFSCAIFNPDGFLVANAPHVPAMIGSMAFAVQSQIKQWKGKLRDSDVLLSNSPRFGGVHLPDLTVTTPVFDAERKNIVFWAASRGHHADVGGILPGSMPPTSRYLWEEGAIFDSVLLIRDGVLDEAMLHRILREEPAQYPGCSGSRCYPENVTDIKAQAAANHCGIRLVRLLIAEYTMPVVRTYMDAIQDAAELAIRNLFKRLAQKQITRVNGHGGLGGNLPSVWATDYMDDGTPLKLKVTMDPTTGSAVFDFSGTGRQVHGNWNAPPAITNSSIIYALRCIVADDIPLNHGCIKPIELIIPEGSILKPGLDAAVCAGNVLTSQRVVDVIFRAFGVCAASQGCMNNFTFGVDGNKVKNNNSKPDKAVAAYGDETGEKGDDDDEPLSFGYYETICGGSGAGPSWQGTSGVHTNMTNTRITDPESLERRYPVILRQFGLRAGSGGRGANPGGDGVVRDVEFRIPMSASMLSERRSMAPWGLEGGEDGQRGMNTWVQGDGTRINIGGKNSVNVHPGDRIVIETPGGGGYGFPV